MDADNTSASTAAQQSQLLLNALPDDEVALKSVLGGLQKQGLLVGSAGEPESVLQMIQDVTTPSSSASVLTVWSRQSILDERVVAVAELALQANCLIPIRIEEVDPPIGFRQAQTYDIVNLTEEAGLSLGQELRADSVADPQSAIRDHGRTSQLLVRVADWVLFVVPPIVIYATLFKILIHETSDYITFIAAAFIVVDTALIGVPAYLGSSDPKRALEKLTHCSRIDLALQFVLALVLSLFATSQFLNQTNVWVSILFLCMITAAAVALLTRYIGIGLWLAYKATPFRWLGVAAPWLIFLISPALLYGGASSLLLHGLVKNALFFYLAISSAQVIVFSVPGFDPLTPERVTRLRIGVFRLTAADLVVQSILSVVGGVMLHIASGQPTSQCIVRFAVCATVATVGRYICLRAWMRFAGSSSNNLVAA